MKDPSNHTCKKNHTVKISLNGEKIKIESGTYIVSDLKDKLSVPADYVLEIIEDCQFRLLDNNEEITICGKEEFISHVQCGGSS